MTDSHATATATRADPASGSKHTPPPGLDRPRRFRPRLAWELLGCGLHGHELIGTDTAHIRGQDGLLAREYDGLRWHRCDSWLPLPPPQAPTRDTLPPRQEIALPLRGRPLRGRPLRDRFVLRLIALDRIVHFLLIGALAVAVLIFAHGRARLRGSWTRILNRLQGATGGPLSDSHHGLLHDLDRLFTVSTGALNPLRPRAGRLRRDQPHRSDRVVVGQTVGRIPHPRRSAGAGAVEIHELTVRISVLKILTLIINLAVVAYLLYAHRLLGVRGGGKADRAERERDTGWTALERAGLGPVSRPGITEV
jgi:hypothetical protein